MISVAKFVGGFSKISNVGIGESEESKHPDEANNKPKKINNIGEIIIVDTEKIIIRTFRLNGIDLMNFFISIY